ncbi:hypothetical protein DOT_5466 [Desulfosporosinus sp. OT]|nr:hypothetical protein DOT_5466 [Desulfosporosinus sp. OT]
MLGLTGTSFSVTAMVLFTSIEKGTSNSSFVFTFLLKRFNLLQLNQMS